MTDALSRAHTDDSFSSELRTVLIADVRGYTRFTQEQGDEAAARLAGRFAEVVEEVVAPRGGQLLELRGDEALVVFSSAREAIRATVELQRRFTEEQERDPSLPLRVGIGLDTGDVVPVKGGYRGGSLNLAARLCSIAGAGEVFCSETVIGLARKTNGIAFVNRGEVTLKGLPAPVRVIQIAPEGSLPEKLPPLQPLLVTHPNNLPDEPTPFIGREREIAQIAGLLREPPIRLVTLTGPGGTGKTRLARQVGNTLLHDFRHGVFFVNLASLTDPALVPSTIAEVLGVKEEAGKDLLTTIADFLRDKHLLLVLDNYEHLLDASSVVSSLLDRCRELHVLVTSRIPLHLNREHEHAVPPLSVPDPKRLPDLETLSQYEAVALFIERARAAKDSFAVTNENAPAVAEICYRLDGLPLAIELAAARIKLFPPQALLQRLGHHGESRGDHKGSALQLLTGGARDRPARQQTLRNTIDWSYSLLSSEEQTLFARLSVFAGGCTFEAAEAICTPEGELDLFEGLASLVDKSLLREEGEEEPRFAMLETIREYARERLEEAGEAAVLTQRHAQHFLDRAREAAAELDGPRRAGWLDRIEAEHDNLRGALGWAQEQEDVTPGLWLAATLTGFWEVRGHTTEGRRWLEGFLATEGGSREARAAAFKAAGRLASTQHDFRSAAELFGRGLSLYRELDDTRNIVELLNWLGGVWLNLLEFSQAADCADEALRLARALGDRALIAGSLHTLAWGQWFLSGVTEARGVREARELAGESLALYRELGDAQGMGDALEVLIPVAAFEDDLPRARALITESADLLRRPGTFLDARRRDRLEFIVFAARNYGAYEEARALLQAGLDLVLRTGNRRDVAHLQVLLALLAREQGDYERAAALLEEGLATFREINDPFGIGRALIGLSDVARDQGDAERTVALAEQSLRLFQEVGEQLLTAYSLHNLGSAARMRGDYRRALELFEQALALNLLGEARAEVLGGVGLTEVEAGDTARAERAFAEGLKICRELKVRWMRPLMLEGLAGVAAHHEQGERAVRLLGAADAQRTAAGTPVMLVNRPSYDRVVAAARDALGEEAFTQAWEQGRAMGLEEAVAYALGETA